MEYNVTYADFDKEVMQETKPVLVDFWATWCGPCRMLAPVLAKIAEENPDIKVCKVNVDEERELAMQFNVTGIPTVLCVKNGEVTGRSVGFVPAPKLLELVK